MVQVKPVDPEATDSDAEEKGSGPTLPCGVVTPSLPLEIPWSYRKSRRCICAYIHDNSESFNYIVGLITKIV